jgi:phycobilisome rod-core linker protein
MTIPLLSYALSSSNQRVAGFEVPGDEQPAIYTTEHFLSGGEIDELIKAAYRQVFNEQQLLASNRQKTLESQLKFGQITVRDFIRALALSDTFRWRNYEPNNNYRFVQMCIQRLLGRDVYGDREKIAWSIVLATKGLQGFIDELLNSQEYLSSFGYNTVPYQRRRILPQHAQGELPFARMPRYGEDYRQQLESLGYFQAKPIPTYRWEWQKPPYPPAVRLIGKVLVIFGVSFVGLVAIASTLAAWGLIEL